ncbi:formate/nitrite transporter family protein [Histidinibacterium aquaticum]|uniref:Formate/nitrite transporter family protein n=2 Tax=Histidinibacterium aquaticum TaxID=2613962 RepID=A0A5J5GLK0_9RHOB|nr:formate/nitrite transporter family protein [Histidinibacterium aquaticum]
MMDEQTIEDRTKMTSRLVYLVVRKEGEEELERTNRSLFWAGAAAGVLISFSVLGEAVLRTYLPDARWAYLVENFGYSFGFMLVILGRMQLFTENTITTVLPLMIDPIWSVFRSVLRLWGLVLFANVLGAFVAAFFMAHTGGVPEEVLPAIHSLSEHATGMGAWTSFIRGIPAGILVAAIVWMLAQADGGEVAIIAFFTWLIAAGDFTHVVAGSVEMAFLMVLGELGPGQGIFEFFLPVLAGNVVGGTLIFAAMAWGQVADEFRSEER